MSEQDEREKLARELLDVLYVSGPGLDINRTADFILARESALREEIKSILDDPTQTNVWLPIKEWRDLVGERDHLQNQLQAARTELETIRYQCQQALLATQPEKKGDLSGLVDIGKERQGIEHKAANFHQTVCAVCGESFPIQQLIGTCGNCRDNASEKVTKPNDP